MQDNELYTYFKDRKHNADKSPGDELWSRIDTNLNNSTVPAASKISSLKLYLITIMIVAGTATGLFFYKDITSVETKKNNVAVTSPRVINTVKSKTIILPEPADSVKKKKAKGAIQVMPFKPVKSPIALTDSIVQQQPLTIKYGNTIKISTDKTLTKSEFDTLVAHNLKLYQNEAGKILLIKAKDYKPFRQLIQPYTSALRVKPSSVNIINGTIKLKNTEMKFKTNIDSMQAIDSLPSKEK